jgi:outer membrane immunogenic protein
MNRFSVATAISLALTAGAAAADMSVRAPLPPAAFSWAGFYGGFNVGYAWSSATDVVSYLVPPPGAVGISNSSEQPSGGFAGGQAGYNWQLGSWILGVEADGEGSSASRTTTSGVLVAGTPVPGTATTVLDKLLSFGTMRGRIGFAFDRWMFYGTGGYAWQYMNSTVSANPGPAIMENYGIATGWAGGAGVEVAFADKWSAKLQYLHIDTGTFNNSTGSLTAPLVTSGFLSTVTGVNETTRMKTDTIQFGVNYHF